MKTLKFLSAMAVLVLMLASLQVGTALADDTITVRLQNSASMLLPGGSLRYHDGAWHTATDNGDGTFTVTTSASSVTYEMTYNNGRQTFSNIPVSTNPVIFTTVSTTVTLRDTAPNILSGGTVRYHQIGWQDFGNANDTQELLPGDYTFEMTYNNGRQTFSNYTVADEGGGASTVLFTTVTTTVALQDSGGGDLGTDGSVRYHQVGWQNFGTSNSALELLPGNYTFEMTYNNGRQTFSNYTVPADPSHEVLFTTVATTPTLKDSIGTTLSGGTVRYHQIGWATWGDANTPQELLPGDYTFEMAYNNGRQTISNHTVPAGDSHEVAFVTTTTIVRLATCADVGLDGGTVRYHQVGWQNYGTTVNGDVVEELLPGNYTFEMTYNNGRQTFSNHIVPAGASHTVPFQTTEVTYLFSDTIQYHQVGWKTFSQPTMDLLPGNYTFKFGTYQTVISVSGCHQGGGSVLIIRLKNSSGAGVADGTAHLGVGGWPVIGTTDANGVLFYVHNGTLGNMKIRMDAPFYGGSQESPVQDTTVNSVYDFQTQQVVIQLKDSAGNLTDGGVVQAGAGGWPGIGATGDDGTGTLYHEHFAGTFKYRMGYHGSSMEIQQDVSLPFIFQTTKAVVRLEDHNGDPLDGGKVLQGIGGWPQIGVTGDGAPGEVWYELFPGTHTFRMSYNYGTEEKSQDIGTAVVFQTGLVDLHFSGSINHGVGGWPAYIGPTEMLPIAHKFRFSSPGHPTLDKFFTPIAGTVFDKSIVIIEFYDHAGAGIDGATAKYYLSGWKDFTGQTGDDGNGILFGLIDGTVGNLKVTLYHAGASQSKTQNQPTDSYFTFQTQLVTVELRNEAGQLDVLPDEGLVKYYAGGWKSIGETVDGVISIELLPLSYKFSMGYGGGTAYQTTSDPTVTFNTHNVTVELRNEAGQLNELPDEGLVKYYASGWKTIGETVDGVISIELLPLSYKFSMGYGGGTAYQTTSDPTVTFNTHNVTVELRNEAGQLNELPDEGLVKYYASGWKTIGETVDGVISIELLPLSYKFSMGYGGGTAYQTTSATPVTFNTTEVTVRLETGAGVGLSGGVAKYYASGWKSFGTTDSSGNTVKELLPLSYKFSMLYNGATNYITQNVGTEPLVVFETQNTLPMVKFTDSYGVGISGATAKYYASGWKTFGVTDSNGEITRNDILPGNYKFSLTYEGGTVYKTQDISVDPIVTFSTKLVTVKLLDSLSGGLPGGEAKFYASGWKSFGTTDGTGQVQKQLLPLSYKFSMGYGGGTAYITQNVDSDPTVTFQTHLVTVELKDSTGTLIDAGTVKYYASGWKVFGTTSGGQVTKELLPLSYKYSMGYEGGTTYQTTADTTVTFQTDLVTVTLKDCDDNGISGGEAKYYASGWKAFGTTDANGETQKELLPLSYKFSMKYGGATNYITQNIDADPTVDFAATLVDFHFGGTVQYYASGWKILSGPTYMLPGTYKFKFGDTYQNIDINGCSMNKTVNILKLKDHTGSGLSGGSARGGYGSSYAGWFVPGITDTSGTLFDFRDGLHTTMSYEMRFNNTTQVKTQDVSVNSVFEFDTNLLTLRMETCGSAPLDGGNPRYGNGSTYTTWWFPGGLTGSSAPGETAAEFFPGTYSFQMLYKSTADAKISMTIPDADALLTWQTTNVTLDYPGQISYGGGTGDSTYFTKPSMELLPGTYKFNFRPDNRVDLTLSGCSFDKAYVALTVLDENGNGVPGGKAKPAYGGSWGAVLPGETDGNGKLFSEIPPGYTKISMAVNQGAVEQLLSQLTSSNYTWHTEILRIWLNDHAGSPITEGNAVLDQGGGTWYNWGNLNTSGYMDVPLFARTSAYKFRMSYNFTSDTQYPVVSTTPGVDNFYFQTGQVFGYCITSYSTGSWRAFSDGTELMPGTYTFRYPSQSGTVTAGEITYLAGCPGVSGSGTLDATTYSAPTVQFYAYEPDSGVFNINYAGPQGSFGEAGTTVSGDIVCLSFDGGDAYLGGLVTDTNSTGGWQVGQYVRFGVSADMLNFTPGEVAMPNCASDGLTPSITLVDGGYSIIQ